MSLGGGGTLEALVVALFSFLVFRKTLLLNWGLGSPLSFLVFQAYC
jgi:hypothetical protein